MSFSRIPPPPPPVGKRQSFQHTRRNFLHLKNLLKITDFVRARGYVNVTRVSRVACMYFMCSLRVRHTHKHKYISDRKRNNAKSITDKPMTALIGLTCLARLRFKLLNGCGLTLCGVLMVKRNTVNRRTFCL